MKITIDELKRLCDEVLSVLGKKGINKLHVDIDYYWTIFTDYSYILDDKNLGKCMGSFDDDWDSVMKVVNNQNHMGSIDCDRLGNIINIVGSAILKSDQKNDSVIIIDDLKNMCKKILTIIEFSGFNEFTIDIDQYRCIDQTEAYNIYEDNQHIVIRSLENDWKKLKELLSHDRQATIGDFELLGNIIKMVGFSISQTKDKALINMREDE